MVLPYYAVSKSVLDDFTLSELIPNGGTVLLSLQEASQNILFLIK